MYTVPVLVLFLVKVRLEVLRRRGEANVLQLEAGIDRRLKKLYNE
jgi:hypothetical protein